MRKVIVVVLFVLIIGPNYYAQQPVFGYKVSDGGEILSDVFLIQNDLRLDSAVINEGSNTKTYKFEYSIDGKLKRDINFMSFRVWVEVNGREQIKTEPGYREYFYNERGDIDSINTGYWNDTIWVDAGGYRIEYTYDNESNIITKTHLQNGISATRIEENSYDSNGKLTLNKVILTSYNDTTYNIKEYDSSNRIIFAKSANNSNPTYYQYLYEYDSAGNISYTIQMGNIYDPQSLRNKSNYYFEFDEYGKVVNQIISYFNNLDSTWVKGYEVPFIYNEDGKVIKMWDIGQYHYDSNGNLDTLVYIRPNTIGGYLSNKATIVDSYGNKITLPSYYGFTYFHYNGLSTTDINESKESNALTFGLSQNYPNPFNPLTVIKYSVPKPEFIQISVHNILGQEIALLVNEEKSIGTYEVTLNGDSFSSGVYFYTMKAGNYLETRKLLLLK